MLIRQKINTILSTLRRFPRRYYYIAGVLLVASAYIGVFGERTLVYSYSGEACDQRLVIFPGLFKQAGGSGFKLETTGGWSVLDKQITATSLCVTPTEPPSENSFETLAYAPWGGWLARLAYKIETPAHPTVNTSVLDEPIPTSRELLLPLSEPDATFSYSIEVEEKQASCESTGDYLSCDVPGLGLKQGSKYSLGVEKSFNKKPIGEVVNANIETLSPLSVTESSIQNEAVVYDSPDAITIETDKPLERAEFAVQRIDGDDPVPVETATTMNGQQARVEFTDELPREATIEVKALTLEAEDGSTPLDAYVLTFKTSGGPKVTGVNVGSSGVTPGSQIVVTFDQELAPDQDLAPFIVTRGGVAYQARQGNQLIFSTSGAGRCATISIALKPDIASPHGISRQSAWEYNGRVSCYAVTTVGHSSQGRPIQAYHFGDSGPAVVYTGAIHGNEVSTKLLMDRWIQELDANPGKIPDGKRVIVIPVINPDGFARGSRVNARNVDLNRNFGTADWSRDIQHTNGSAFPGGGGDEPMSEPEVRAIAGFIAQQRPELVVSYHSIGGLVISNQGGQANARASQYAGLSGYRLSPGDSGEFGYQITGTADDYYREKLGVPSILIELGSHSHHQFERNQAAMWAMLR